MHRVGRCEIGIDLLERPDLGRCQPKGEVVDEVRCQSAPGIVDDSPAGLAPVALLRRQRHLEPEQLVEGEPASARLHLVECPGEVDAPQGGVPLHQPQLGQYHFGYRVRDGPRHRQRLEDGAPQVTGAHLLDRWVDRDDPPGDQALLAPEQVHRRALHLRTPPEPLDLARQRHLGTGLKLALTEGLVEPGGLQAARAVGEDRVDHDQVAPRAALRHRDDLGEHRHLGVTREVGDPDAGAPVDVAAGDMEDQVRHRLDSPLAQQLGALL